MAPSISTPAVAYFQSATSSLRARATIIVLPRRPPVRLNRARIKRTGGRLGKTMIVALARKLLVALWKYATAGVLMEGAVLKPA